MYNNVDIRNHYYGVIIYDKDGNEIGFDRKGKEVRLDEVRINIEDGEVVWGVSFDYMSMRRHVDIPRNNISDKKCAAYLQGKGADITVRTFNCFVDSMRWQERMVANRLNIYKKVGWIKIPYNGTLEYAYRCSKLVGNMKARYDGELALTPKGSFEVWKSMVLNEVIGRTPLETILLAALSAPIVGIHGINTTTDNPIYHINFSSGKGKSTVCFLATSVSGEPFDGMRTTYDNNGIPTEKSSIYSSWGATANATVSSHAGNRGVVAILNELGKFEGNDMTSLVFNLSEGSDIKRLNKQLQPVVSEGFNTVFISCGEMSLIDKCKAKIGGIRTRVMEISVPMTENAEHSRRIKACCVENNGYAAPMIAKHIIYNGGYDMVQNLYDKTLKELTETAPQGIDDRYIEKFPAFLVVAAKLAEKALGIHFNIEKVVQFCYKCVADSKEEDGDICKSYNEMVEEFDINVDKFYDVRNPQYIPKTAWGKVSYPEKEENNRRLLREYTVYPNLLRAMLKNKGYQNPNTELKIWRDKGVLDCEGNHLTKRVNFKSDNNKSSRMYVVQVWDDILACSEMKNIDWVEYDADYNNYIENYREEEQDYGNIDPTGDC